MRTWKHGQGHENMDKEMETWTRTWENCEFLRKNQTENGSPSDFP